MSNPFDEFLQQPAPQQQAPQSANPFENIGPAMEQQEEQTPSTFHDKLVIFNRGFERYALGGLQLINNIPLLNKALPTDEQLAIQNAKSEQQYQEAYKRTPSPITGFIGEAGGATLAAGPALLATTTAGPTTAVGALGQAVIGGAASGFVDYAPTNTLEERAYKAGVSGLLSGAAAGTIMGGSAIVHNLLPKIGSSSFVKKIFNPNAAAKEDIANAVLLDAANNPQAALQKVAEAKPLAAKGMTPGEALGGTVTRANEGGIAVEEAAKGPVAESILNRAQAVKQQIYDTIDNMATPQVKEAKTAAFTAMKSDYIAPDGSLLKGQAPASTNYVPDVIKNNDILTKKYQEVLGAKSEAWSSLPNNSVAKLHKVKDLIDDELFKSKPNPKTGNIIKELSPDESLAYKEALDQLKPVLEQSSAYNEAMAASRSIKIHDYYQELISTKKASPGAKGDLSLDQVFDAVMPQKMLQNKFMKDVVATGGDPQQVAQLVNIADSLRKSPLLNILKGTKEGSAATSIAGRSEGIAQRFISNLTLDRYYKAMLDISLSGDKWADDISKVLQQKVGQPQQTGFLELIGKVTQAIAPRALNAQTTNISSEVMKDDQQ